LVGSGTVSSTSTTCSKLKEAFTDGILVRSSVVDAGAVGVNTGIHLIHIAFSAIASASPNIGTATASKTVATINQRLDIFRSVAVSSASTTCSIFKEAFAGVPTVADASAVGISTSRQLVVIAFSAIASASPEVLTATATEVIASINQILDIFRSVAVSSTRSTGSIFKEAFADRIVVDANAVGISTSRQLVVIASSIRGSVTRGKIAFLIGSIRRRTRIESKGSSRHCEQGNVSEVFTARIGRDDDGVGLLRGGLSNDGSYIASVTKGNNLSSTCGWRN
jgi:hypothetical protein